MPEQHLVGHVDARGRVHLAVHPERDPLLLGLDGDGRREPLFVEEEPRPLERLTELGPGELLEARGRDHHAAGHDERLPSRLEGRDQDDEDGQRDAEAPGQPAPAPWTGEEHGERGGQVEQDGHGQGALDADQRHEGEAGEEGAGDRAQGVDGQQRAHPLGHRPARLGRETHAQREDGARAQRRSEDHGTRDQELERQEARVVAAAQGEQPHECVGQLAQDGEADGRREGSSQLHQDDRDPDLAETVGPARHEEATDGEAHEESDQHDGERVDRRSEHEGESPGPGDLTDQGERAGHRGHAQGETVGSGPSARGRGRLGTGDELTAEQEGRHAHGDVQSGRYPVRPARAQPRQEAEPRDAGAEDRAEDVHRVEPPEPPAARVEARRDHSREERERRAHAGGRDDQQQRGEREARQGEGGERRGIRGAGGGQCRRDRVEERGHRERIDADPELEHAVGEDRPPDASRQASAGPAANRETRHERRQRGADRQRGGAEDEREPPEPDDLVDQAARARQEETECEHDPPWRLRDFQWSDCAAHGWPHRTPTRP